MPKRSKRAAVLTGPQRKFCAAYAVDQNGTAAYRAAYPKSSAESARRSASELLTKPDIIAELARIRAVAESLPGSAPLTLAEKRNFIAGLVRAAPALLPPDSNLWQSVKVTEQGTEYRLPDKLAAIKLDNDLAGEGSESEANDALTALLGRVSK